MPPQNTQPQGMQSQDIQLHDTSAYESPKITDLSDGTTPLATSPGAAIPS